MTKFLRTVLAGIVTLATMAAWQPLQAQTTLDPLFYCGVVGGGTLMTTQGTSYTFQSTARASFSSVTNHPAWVDVASFSFSGSNDSNLNFLNLAGSVRNTVLEPSFVSGMLQLQNGTTAVGTQEMYVVVFADTVHRDAFLYYVQQREAAATEADYLYFTALAAYEFWIGQEDEGLSLYAYYTGMADYILERDFDTDPQQAMYDYHYNIGLGAYYYFMGIGDEESANLAFYYHYQLAVAALEEEPPVEEM